MERKRRLAQEKLADRRPSEGRRLLELDSIRGLASLSVVLLHFHAMWMPNDPARLPAWVRVVLTVLLPFYSGSEAVILFFLLSGLVLSLPYLRGKGQPYPRYLLRRVLRVYGPYATALALAIGGATIWHGHAYHGDWAAAAWSRPVNAGLVAQHILFLGVYDWRQFDFVIWSLIQEMRLSIFFPLLFALAMHIGGAGAVSLGILLSGLAMAIVPSSPDLSARYSLGITVHYTAFFLVGIAFASRLDRVERWWKDTSHRTHWLLGAGGLVAYTFDGSIAARSLRLLHHGNSAGKDVQLIVANWVTALGALALMTVGLHAVRARRMLRSRVAVFLGRISYSLYLMHPLVLLGLTFTCGARVSMWIQFPLYLFGALLLGWLFCIVVEEPFTRLSRAV